MDKEEFEKQLLEFEKNVRKKLPALINSSMALKGNREVQASFTYFLDNLRRLKSLINRDLEKYARPAQRMRFFNTINTMESLLRAMSGRNNIQERLRQKQHKISEHIEYDAGQGHKDGELLNIFEDGVLLKTSEKMNIDRELDVSLKDGRHLHGKVIWSVIEEDGSVETGIKLDDISSDLDEELHQLIDDKLDNKQI